MKKIYYILKVFKFDGTLYKTFIFEDYQNVILMSEKMYKEGYSYSVEVVK